MCVLCMISRDLNPLEADFGTTADDAVLSNETVDAAESSSTTYTMSVGGSFSGTLSDAFDEDWIAIEFEAGQTYQIDMVGGTLSDPYLTLIDNFGSWLAFNDDSGGTRDSSIVYTAAYTGTHYIEADAYSTETGTYSIFVSETTPPELPADGTIAELADFLQDWDGETYVWDTSDVTVDITGLTADGQQLAIWAMEAWEMVADINFLVRGGGLNEFSGTEMITADDEYGGAYAYVPGTTNAVGGVELNVETSWLTSHGTSIDSYSMQTYVHEFGHALGLNHLGDYNGFGTYPNDATFGNDSWQLSIMSYFSQTDNTSVNASYGGLVAPMIADLVAIQELYGTPGASSATAGDTTYGLNSNLGNYLDELFAAIASGTTSANVEGNPIAFTIYDQSGIDTIDLSYTDASTDTRIDMASGSFSDIGTSIGSLAIAIGTVIENLNTGSGEDEISGNGANNEIHAGAGNDLIFGGVGGDSLYGDAGDDGIFAGGDNDFIYGGADNDTVGAGAGNDLIYGGGGDDTVWGSNGNDTVYGDDGNDFIGSGRNNDRVFGGDGEDTMYGGGGRDYVTGGRNDDLIGGSFGTDTLYGNSGNDTLWGQVGNDILYGGDGIDTLAGGSGSDQLYGGNDADDLNGGFGGDRLFGGDGDDTLNGGGSSDTLEGGLGADTFVFLDSGNDRVTDFLSSEGDQIAIDMAGLGAGSGPWTGQDIIDTYADDSSGTVIITVNSLSITLQGVSSVAGLEDYVYDWGGLA